MFRNGFQPQLSRRGWRWFAGWMIAGFATGFAVASLPSIGLFVLPAAALLIALLTWKGRGTGFPGFFGGGAALLFMLAYVHRFGPGEHCRTVGEATECGQFLDPRPLALFGLLCLAICFLLFAVSRRAANRKI